MKQKNVTESIETKHGVVILLDALGARTASIEDGKRYLASLDILHQRIHETRSAIAGTGVNQTELSLILDKMDIKFFGDAVLITCSIDTPDTAPEIQWQLIKKIGWILVFFVFEGIKKRILFRGAITIGDYIQNNAVVLGPAISDVANWYEKSEMIGVFATPKMAFAIQEFETLKKQNDEDNLVSPWLPYDVPTKLGDLNTFSVAWPSGISVLAKQEGTTQEAQFYKMMKGFEQPIGTEKKYTNTEKFYMYHLKREADLLKNENKSKT